MNSSHLPINYLNNVEHEQSLISQVREFHARYKHILINRTDRLREYDRNTMTESFNLNYKTSLTSDEFCKIVNCGKESPRFSYFKKPISNIAPTGTLGLTGLFYVIKDFMFYGQKTEQLRSLVTKVEKRQFKEKHFDYVTISGIFDERNSSKLIEHSNLLCLDFDNVPDKDRLRTDLIDDPNTIIVFTSPSGNGLKWIIRIDGNRDHKRQFDAVSNYCQRNFDIMPDPSGKDVSRAAFIGHDPDVFIKPIYLFHE